ncbi:MAG: YicC family protein [candidate division WOR-3 bacterium]|uniref:YicC family protein n=1 Tax=candidate division WOR-3 bacterium TaxID=2052148 RepID=A0A7C1SBY2_UNCW3|nr:YicC family protein [candidate division WOR-3 bacterium]
MIRSMTGVGRAEGVVAESGTRIAVDIRSVNHKYFELVSKLPPQLVSYERDIYEIVRRKIRRGYVQLQLTIDEPSTATCIKIDWEAAKRYLTLIRQLKRRFNLSGEVDLNALLTLPGVITTSKVPPGQNRLWRASRKIIGEAIRQLIRMREAEGTALVKDLRRRINKIRRALHYIRERVPKRVAERRENLIEQLANLNIQANSKRILEEVAYITERLDIHEECVRLRSHCSMFLRALRSSSTSGKKLDFIAQEMLRETDTLAAKARDVVISRRAIEIKGEIEKLKEQVRNVE